MRSVTAILSRNNPIAEYALLVDYQFSRRNERGMGSYGSPFGCAPP